jgi:hypothetical protein
VQLWRDRRGINERELARLDEQWPGPRLEIPLLPIARGPSLVDALRPWFEQLAGVRGVADRSPLARGRA